MTATAPTLPADPVRGVVSAAASPAEDVLRALGVSADQGLSGDEVLRRQAEYGPNAVASHKARVLAVLWHQLRSPLLGLLMAAAVVSFLVGERSDAVIIGVIVAVSVGLGFVNEYRAEKAAEALHSQIHHETVVLRDGRPVEVDVTVLVPGDVVELRLGDVVPADIRLLAVTGLECDESVLTGESLPVDKNPDPVPAGTPLAELAGCALMGTVVHADTGRGIAVATGPRTEFGKIAAGLDTHPLDTAFQVGLRKFSMLLVYVAGALTTSIFVMNVVLHKPIIDALLFSLAIAVGITPQLLPAVVSTSLAAGSRRMSKRRVLVKRLVCIEDLGDVDMLFTDKTGTLTAGRIDYERVVPVASGGDADGAQEVVLRWALLCTENSAADGQAVGGNPLDQALWQSAAGQAQRPALADYTRLATLPFDHERRMASTLVRDAAGQATIITKGAPESVLDRCLDVPDAARKALETEFAAGNRVVAVATRSADGAAQVTPDNEEGLTLIGLLVFLDPPKQDAAGALRRLADLGIAVKVVTGDNAAVALKVCRDLGLGGGEAFDRSGHRSARRRPAGGGDRDDHRVRPGQPRGQGPDRARAAAVRRRCRLPGRRGQRRARPARRRRRDLRGLGHRRRQGRRRRDPAGEGPRRPRRRRHRRPPHLRQHHQVRAHGHIQQLRQHGLGRRRVAVPFLPADAAVPDPSQQPAVRHQPAGHPHRQRRRRAAAPAGSRVRRQPPRARPTADRQPVVLSRRSAAEPA